MRAASSGQTHSGRALPRAAASGLGEPGPLPPSATGPRERGRQLTTALLLMIAMNATSATLHITIAESIRAWIPNMTEALSALFATTTLLNVACLTLVWRWRKIGVYGFVGVAALTCVLGRSLGVAWPAPLFPLVGPSILVALVRPRWPLFS